MNEKIKDIIKPLITIAAIIFLLFCFVKKPDGLEDYFSYVGYSITVVTILFVLYEKYLWKFNPKNKNLVLKKKYDGTIVYKYKSKDNQKKSIQVEITQSWLTIDIKTETDINSSSTVSGTIVEEHGKQVLYYTYITNPNAINQKDNPIQYGTCRMVLDGDNKRINGKYWTSSQTIGDIEWVENKQKRREK